MTRSTTQQSKRNNTFDETELKLAFEFLDPNNTGTITHTAIKSLCTVLGLNYTHSHIKHMLKQQNCITYQQLYTLMKHIDHTDTTHITDSYNLLTANTPHIHNIATILLNSHKLDDVTENDLNILQQLCDCDSNGNMTLKTFEQLLHKPVNYAINLPYRAVTGDDNK